MHYDTDGLSQLSSEIEESAEMIAFLRAKFLCYAKGYTIQRVVKELAGIHSVPEDFAQMKVEGWKREREVLRQKRKADELGVTRAFADKAHTGRKQ